MDKARIYVDFNELVDENTVLLSKDDTQMDSDGNIITFYEGIAVKRDLSGYGHWENVKWCCCFDKNSIIHESDLK